MALFHEAQTVTSEKLKELNEATKDSIDIDELLKPENGVSRIDLDTGSGTIALENDLETERRSDRLMPGLTVIESEDPSIKPGEIIALEGSSLSGGALAKPGLVAPHTRVAYQVQKRILYKPGTVNSDPTKDRPYGTLTPESISRFLKDDSGIYSPVEDGLEMRFWGAKMGATDFVGHIIVTERQSDGSERSRYVF